MEYNSNCKGSGGTHSSECLNLVHGEICCKSKLCQEGKKLHPLENDVILTNLFKYLTSVELLARARLVCKTWCDVSLSSWHSTAIINLTFAEDDTWLKEFLQFWELNCKDVPYRQFKLRFWKLEEDCNHGLDVSRFWEVVGPHMSNLILDCCLSTKPENFFGIINQSCPILETLVLDKCSLGPPKPWDWQTEELNYTFPEEGEHLNLKSLHLYARPGDDVSSSLGLTYLELLAHFPNLTCIKLRNYHQCEEILELLKAVKSIRLQRSPTSFPSLKLDTFHPVKFEVGIRDPSFRGSKQRPVEMTNLLRELQIPLKSICIDDSMSIQEVQDMVHFHGATLTILTAPMRASCPRPRCNFPFGLELQNLVILRMSEHFCKSFNFIKFTPNLERLYLEGDEADPHDMFHRRQYITEETTLVSNASKSELANLCLLKLTFLKFDKLVSEGDLKCLVRWMPRVTEMEMFMSDRLYHIICEGWPNLEKLTVLGVDSRKNGVSGTVQYVIPSRRPEGK